MSELKVESPLTFRTTLPELEGYFRPKSLDEALSLLSELGERAKIYAGGTDLLIDMRLRNIGNKVVVDIKEINELRGIREEGDSIFIGATTTIHEIKTSSLIASRLPLLKQVVERFADQFIRTRATVGGNLCNASPAADTPLALLIYGSEVEIASVAGRKRVPIKDFFKGVKRTILAPGELVTGVRVPVPQGRQRVKYLRFDRSSEDLMIVGIAGAVFEGREPGDFEFSLSYGAVAPTPLLFKGLQDAYKRGGADEVLKIVKEKVSPISDVRASKEYRMHLVEVGTRLIIKELLGGV
ncbi:MAG: xanthine dehydrogenase family protein subunit M [Fervidicoccus sp.]|nr:MAG: xanthine dehydrogenase family protein subunit M [Fervidicoccus sp.]